MVSAIETIVIQKTRGGFVKRELIVEGVHCKSCKRLIEEDVSAVPGVDGVEADFVKGRVIVEFDGLNETLEKIRSAIRKLGYKLR